METYTRNDENDVVIKADLINSVINEANNYANVIKFKNKEGLIVNLSNDLKIEFINAINTLGDAIKSGTLFYNPKGGFKDKNGILSNSKSDDFDAIGLAAGLFGSTLRNMDAYEAPIIETKLNPVEEETPIEKPKEEEKEEETPFTPLPLKDWLNENYPRLYPNDVGDYIVFKNEPPGSQWSVDRLNDKLKTIKNEYLYSALIDQITGEYNIENIEEVLNYLDKLKYPNSHNLKFDGDFIANQILNILKNNGYLNQFANDLQGHTFYFPETYSKKRGTVLVWDSLKNKIIEQNIYDSLGFGNYLSNLYTNYSGIPSNKKGGILKAQFGLSTPVIGATLASNYKTPNYLDYSNPFTANLDLYTGSMLNRNQEFKGHLGSNQTSGINWNLKDRPEGMYDANNNTIRAANTLDAINAMTAYHNKGTIAKDALYALSQLKGNYVKLQDILNAYNNNVKELREWQNNKLSLDYNSTGLKAFNLKHHLMYGNYNDYNELGDDILGFNTYVRLANTFKNLDSYKDLRQFKLDGFNDNIWMDNLGYLHLGEYGVNNGVTAGSNITGSTITEDEGANEPPTVETPQNRTNIVPDLLTTLRLWKSLDANKKVESTVSSALKPLIQSTYERYSPVTGAFSEMQLRNRQASQMLSSAYRPFTSDANLVAARMNQGQIQANELQHQGFLADDVAVRKAAAEALTRQEDNAARRADIANKNRASIIDTNLKRANLATSRIKSDWASWDGYLRGFEERMRAKEEQYKDKYDNFWDIQDTKYVDSWYERTVREAQRELEKAQRDYEAKNRDGVFNPSLHWNNYNRYIDFMKHAAALREDLLYNRLSARYKYNYKSPFNQDLYKLFSWGNYINPAKQVTLSKQL